jgi:hypothetical protein
MKTSEPFGSLDMYAVAADPSLVGHRLAQLRQPQHITREQQTEALRIDRERLTTQCSCRLPRDQAELELIAARIGWKPGWAFGCPLYQGRWQMKTGLHRLRCIRARHKDDLV